MIQAPFVHPIADPKRGFKVDQGWVSWFQQQFPVAAPVKNPSQNTDPRSITSTTTTANPFTYQNLSGFYQWVSAWSAVAGVQYQFSRDGVTFFNVTGTVPAQAHGFSILAPRDYFRIQTGGNTVNYVIVPL